MGDEGCCVGEGDAFRFEGWHILLININIELAATMMETTVAKDYKLVKKLGSGAFG